MRSCATHLRRLCLLAALLPCAELRAQSEDVDPVKVLKVKAAFLLNFGKFVAWPESAFDGPDAPFVIGVIEPDPFGRILDDTVAGKRIHGRRVRVVRLRHSELERVARCHILFVSAKSPVTATQVTGLAEGLPVLVVGDRPGFASGGGMIGFVLERGHIRFEVCRAALTRAGLNAVASFLKLARLVENTTYRGAN